MCVKGSLADMV